MSVRTTRFIGRNAPEDRQKITGDDRLQAGQPVVRDSIWRVTRLETPIFADPSGHRARVMSLVGVGVVLATVAALVIVAMGAIGFAKLPLPLPVLAGGGDHTLIADGHRPRSHDVALVYQQSRAHKLRADLRTDRQAHPDFQ